MTDSTFDLNGTVALITGGTSGIGLGMAEALVAAGAEVCIWGRNPEKTARAGDHLAAKSAETGGGKTRALVCDVADEQAVEAAFAETLEIFGRVDACFANAGVAGQAKSFVDMSTEEWRRVMAVNMDGAFFTLRAAARHMVARGGGGSLVGTASLAAIEGQARGQHYAATKGGLISMIRALAVELGRDGIRANAILPGWIKTDMTDAWLDRDSVRSHVLPRVPAGRWGAPRDFGGVACYLASSASLYHSGDTFVIDGAYSLF